MSDVAALFVEAEGVYFGLDDIDPWDQVRDAKTYAGPQPVIAHPPCARWGRYWYGGPSCKVRKVLGDDDGCFASALESVRTYGGVLEHPEASYAWSRFGLSAPLWTGGWFQADVYGGMTCCVSQGHYGHEARKMTWLYVFGCPIGKLPRLIWGPSRDKMRIEDSYPSKSARIEGQRDRSKNGIVENRLSHKARARTPLPFRDLLISIARECSPLTVEILQPALLHTLS